MHGANLCFKTLAKYEACFATFQNCLKSRVYFHSHVDVQTRETKCPGCKWFKYARQDVTLTAITLHARNHKQTGRVAQTMKEIRNKDLNGIFNTQVCFRASA